MDVPNLVAALESSQVYKVIYTCNAALFLYEYMITLGDEIEHIWGAAWGPAVFLYFASRYSVIPEICLCMLFFFGDLHVSTCRILSGYVCFSVGIGMFLGQCIIILRTWALWNGSRVIMRLFSAVCIGMVALSLFLSTKWAVGSQFVASSASVPYLSGCVMAYSYPFLFVGWAFSCGNDVALICLTVIKYQQENYCLRSGPTPFLASSECQRERKLSSSLYRDAFASFTMMLVFALTNLICTLVVPVHYRVLLYGTERILYTSFACRTILNLRAAAGVSNSLGTIENTATGHVIVFSDGEMDRRVV